jgi:hypothetical protein
MGDVVIFPTARMVRIFPAKATSSQQHSKLIINGERIEQVDRAPQSNRSASRSKHGRTQAE